MKIGYCLTGSFCTFSKSVEVIKSLVEKGHTVIPVMSEYSYSTDTKFGKADDFINKIEEMTGNRIIHTIKDAEPIGPKKMFDVLAVIPCSGNTLAKLALGINDTTVTMAVKSHLRNSRPVVIGVSTNDALGNSAKNIGMLMNYKCYHFVPFTMDDPLNKPRSMVCDFSLISATIENAFNNKDMIQKIF